MNDKDKIDAFRKYKIQVYCQIPLLLDCLYYKLNVSELCRECNISRQAFYNLIQDKSIPGIDTAYLILDYLHRWSRSFTWKESEMYTKAWATSIQVQRCRLEDLWAYRWDLVDLD